MLYGSFDASRSEGAAHVKEVFDIAARIHSKYSAMVGVGIGGDGVAGPCRLFRELYSEARRRGLRLTAHCGEATGLIDGPREIRDALDMSVERLGQAYCAQYDPELLDELRESRTILELNVTSNICTGVCSTLEEHPIKKYFDHGLVCTINSDDPAMFGSNVLNEYLLVQKSFGFTLEEMKTFASDSFRGSFLSREERDALVNSVAAY